MGTLKVRLYECVEAVVLWAIIATPVAVVSGILAAWPLELEGPFLPVLAAIIGIVSGVCILAVFRLAWVGKEDDKERTSLYLRCRRALLTLLAVVMWAIVVVTLVWFLRWRSAFDVPTTVSIILGVILGQAVFSFLNSSRVVDWFQKHAATLSTRKTRGQLLWAMVLSTALGISLVFLLRMVCPITKVCLLRQIVYNPGGMFVFVTGVSTLAGVYLTAVGLTEFRNTITTFADFLTRLCDLIEDTGLNDSFGYLCYTPITGHWAVPPYLWDRFFPLIGSQGRTISMVVLNKDDLKSWYESFLGRTTVAGKITAEKVKEGIKMAEIVISSLDNSQSATKKAGLPPVRLPYDKMPGYYFFFNAKRAIVVSPVFLPIGISSNNNGDKVDITKLQSVQVVGIETVDRGIVAWLHELHDVYRGLGA